IISLENVLFELEKQSPTRDAENYYVSIFGQPGTAAWGWRFEGHHISLNFAIAGEEVAAVTPSFLGANPAKVLDGPRKGLRALAREEDSGWKLVQSLAPEQRSVAIVATNAPREIVTGNDRKAKPLEPMGIAAAKLNASQKETFLALVKNYLFRYRSEIA